MAAPVWVLSVDLQAKTATFTSGLADAAKSARGAFTDIRNSANDASEGTSRGLTNVRAGLGLLDNTIRGNHAAAMADIIREFQHTQFVMAALPLAATTGGILLLAGIVVEIAKKVKEWREEQEHLTDEEQRFATAVNSAYNALDSKLLQSGIRADELRNDHLAALHKQLQLIDRASMDELIHEFGLVGKAADELFGHLQTSWYQTGIGSAGAKHALEEFGVKYEALLTAGKDKEASDLLAGTRASAERILAAQQQAAANVLGNSGGGDKGHDYQKFLQAANALKAAGVGYTEKEIAAQQTLVDALRAQVSMEEKVATLKKLDQGNAKTTVDKELGAMSSQAAKEAADHTLRMGEIALAAQREHASAELAVQNATIQQRLASDVALADKERDIQLAANAGQIAALDKGAKDYHNQLQSLNDKALEIVAQHDATVAGLRDKAQVEQYRKDLTDLQQSEREKIEATDQGSAERLAAIDAAIREEEAKGLQLTQFYRELLTMRVGTQRQARSEEDKLRADAGKVAAQHDLEMGTLAAAAEREKREVALTARRMTDQIQMAEALKTAEEEYQLKQRALQQEIDALDKYGKDYTVRLQALQDKQKELVRAHENEVTQIHDQAQKNRNARILQGETQLQDAIASGMARTLTGHQTFGAMILSIGDQIASGMIQNALTAMMANDMTKPSDAAAAARKAYLAGMHFPFPLNIVMGPTLGAMAFASVMAFEGGTDMVPGVGRGDVTPAMLTPGEGVVPGGVMDGLRNVARSGGFNNRPSVHIHAPIKIDASALDGEGMDRVLEKHGTKLQRHFEGVVRKMNR